MTPILRTLLLFSALGLWGAFSQWEVVHTVVTLKPLSLVLQTSPTVLIVLAFTLLYLFMPNTHVKPWAALGGATFAGIAWQIAGWLFASFVVSSGQPSCPSSACAAASPSAVQTRALTPAAWKR